MEPKNRSKLERAMRFAYKKAGEKAKKKLIEKISEQVGLPTFPKMPWEIWGDYQEALNLFLENPVLKAYQEAAKRLSQGFDVNYSWELVNQGAKDWAESYTYDLVKDITNTDRKLLQEHIAKFYHSGLSLEEVTGLVSQSPAFSNARANLISITETTRASTQGELALVNELEKQGFIMDSFWATNEDEKVCPICGPNDKEKRGDGWFDPPPAHPRCRCWLNHVPHGVTIEHTTPPPEQAQQQGLEPLGIVETKKQLKDLTEKLYPGVKINYGKTFPENEVDRKVMIATAADRLYNLKKRGVPSEYLPDEIRLGYKSDFTKSQTKRGVVGYFDPDKRFITFNPAYTNISFNTWFTRPGGFNLGDAFTHEAGHAAHYAFFNQLTGKTYIPWEDVSPSKTEISQYVSKYATKDSVEAVAEIYAGLMNDIKFPKRIIDIYKLEGGPPVPGKVEYTKKELEALKEKWK